MTLGGPYFLAAANAFLPFLSLTEVLAPFFTSLSTISGLELNSAAIMSGVLSSCPTTASIFAPKLTNSSIISGFLLYAAAALSGVPVKTTSGSFISAPLSTRALITAGFIVVVAAHISTGPFLFLGFKAASGIFFTSSTVAVSQYCCLLYFLCGLLTFKYATNAMTTTSNKTNFGFVLFIIITRVILSNFFSKRREALAELWEAICEFKQGPNSTAKFSSILSAEPALTARK